MWAFSIAIVLFGLAGSALAQQNAPETVVPVGTTVAVRKPIARTADFVGRVQAIERVEIQARITGYLEQVLFKEGDLVKAGAALYRIEKGLFQAAVDQAQGALAASKAKKLLTAIQYERAEQLMKTSAGTVVARDQALTADRAADAQILIDQANLDTAKIKLGYTDITSPVTGKIGRTMLTKGNVVSPQSGTLTTIVSQDPIYVLFPVSQRSPARPAGESRSRTLPESRRDCVSPTALPTARSARSISSTSPSIGPLTPCRFGPISEPQRRADRRPTGHRQSRGRNPRRTGGGAAAGTDHRPARRLRLCRRGRQGGDAAHQDRRANGEDMIVEQRLVGRREASLSKASRRCVPECR